MTLFKVKIYTKEGDRFLASYKKEETIIMPKGTHVTVPNPNWGKRKVTTTEYDPVDDVAVITIKPFSMKIPPSSYEVEMLFDALKVAGWRVNKINETSEEEEAAEVS